MLCSSDKESPRISAYDIHEQIYIYIYIYTYICMKLRLELEALSRIQLDGPKRQVHVKITKAQTLVDYYDGRTDGRYGDLRACEL